MTRLEVFTCSAYDFTVFYHMIDINFRYSCIPTARPLILYEKVGSRLCWKITGTK